MRLLQSQFRALYYVAVHPENTDRENGLEKYSALLCSRSSLDRTFISKCVFVFFIVFVFSCERWAFSCVHFRLRIDKWRMATELNARDGCNNYGIVTSPCSASPKDRHIAAALGNRSWEENLGICELEYLVHICESAMISDTKLLSNLGPRAFGTRLTPFVITEKLHSIMLWDWPINLRLQNS